MTRIVDQPTTWWNLLAQIDVLLANQRAIMAQGVEIMATLDDLQADVTAENTVIDGAVTLLKGLADQLKAAGTDPAKLTALHTDITAKTTALAAAVAANTPAAP